VSATMLESAVDAHRAGNLPEAERLYLRLLESEPQHFDALHLLGVLRMMLQEFPSSLECIQRAIRVRPNVADAHYHLGLVLSQSGRPAEAVTSLTQAIALKPNFVEALTARVLALIASGREREALADYDRLLEINPDDLNALWERSLTLHLLRRQEEAVASFRELLQRHPQHVDAHNRCGCVLAQLRRFPEALEHFEAALAVQPDQSGVLFNCVAALSALKRYDEAILKYERALAIAPDAERWLGDFLLTKQNACDWRDIEALGQRVLHDMCTRPDIPSGPLILMGIECEPADQLKRARMFTEMSVPPVEGGNQRARGSRERIRVAYLSANYNRHPVAYSIADLLERHDRSRFEIVGISFGRDDGSPIRDRIATAFDEFHDVQSVTDAEVANLMRDLGVDIAVDLMGHTDEARPAILSSRPAPIQVNYLGYPGTTAAGFIDYILADRFVIPQEQRAFYTEKVAWLPHCYLPADGKLAVAERTPARAEHALPDDAFVFCCFGTHYKISPAVFRLWMRLLRAVPDGVLWLNGNNPSAERNLRNEAAANRIDPARLIFAEPIERLDEHLARHRLADLYLDTYPYNAHSTARDALWVGVPFLTRSGRTFASRVAGSVLHAADLPELVTSSEAEYEARALELARDGGRLARIRAHLAVEKARLPLFDTARLTRHVEAAFTAMCDTHDRGQPPQDFAVEARV
jgi:protein O-GlcNAc transferase